MNEAAVALPPPKRTPRHRGPEGRRRRYLLTLAIALTFIWGVSLAVLLFAPRSFTSSMTIILPGAGIDTAVKLESIGQATASASNPFGYNSLSPMVNYKGILESARVRSIAAEILGITKEELNKPRAKVADQTQLITVTITGPSPDAAQARLNAILEAFQSELNRLRRDEIAQRESNYVAMVKSFQHNLEQVRARIQSQQSVSGLITVNQFNQLVEISEQLGKQVAEVAAVRQQKVGEMSNLAASLGISAQGAAQALALQSDPTFQSALKVFAESSQKLSENRTKWGEGHSEVIAEKSRREAAMADMRSRANELIGPQKQTIMRFLEAEGGRNQAELLQRLVALSAEESGYAQQVVELEARIEDLRQRIRNKATAAATLDDMFRDLKLAETVFSSALAKIDTGKIDLFASYPMVQLLESPTLPERWSSPNTLLVLVGAVFGSLFICIGLGLLWIRHPFLNSLQKNG